MLAVIIAEYAPKAVYLYGSVARGAVSEWSDLDLVIIKDTSEPFLNRTATVLRLVKPIVGVDICVYTPEEWLDLTRRSRFAQEEIGIKGKQLYAA